MIVTDPFFLPLATPLADTVATLALELDQVKLWFGTVLPLLSIAVAVSCMVFPTFTFFDGAETLTDATVAADAGGGGVAGGAACAPALTVIVAMPDLPSAFAATREVPTASAVTTPVDEMPRMLGSWTVQVMAAPGTTAPDPSCTSA